MRFAGRLIFSVALLLPAAALQAADHLDAPGVMSRGDLDINDLYIFQAPNPDNAVLIMTVNPGAGAISGTEFATDATYQFQIDNTGDAVPDVTYTAAFTGTGPAQTYTVTRSGSATPFATGTVGSEGISTLAGARVQAGVFDDPFFFDLNGFNNGLNFTGDDFFAGLNVSAIVLEVPSIDFTASPTNTNVGVQAVTSQNVGGQSDRMGRPAINTVLIGDGRKDDFNAGIPANDFAEFGAEVNAAIAGLSDQANADALDGVLLPDLLTFDAANSSGFLNGRRLADDVIDAELNLLTAGAVTTDGVDANVEGFRNVFPYLQVANAAAIPEPVACTFLVAVLVGGLHGRRRRA